MFTLIVFVAVAIALLTAVYNFLKVKQRDAGTDEMKEIAAAIREGSDAFIAHEYKIISIVSICVFVLLSVVVQWYVGVAFFNRCYHECDSRLCWYEDSYYRQCKSIK